MDETETGEGEAPPLSPENQKNLALLQDACDHSCRVIQAEDETERTKLAESLCLSILRMIRQFDFLAAARDLPIFEDFIEIVANFACAGGGDGLEEVISILLKRIKSFGRDGYEQLQKLNPPLQLEGKIYKSFDEIHNTVKAIVGDTPTNGILGRSDAALLNFLVQHHPQATTKTRDLLGFTVAPHPKGSLVHPRCFHALQQTEKEREKREEEAKRIREENPPAEEGGKKEGDPEGDEDPYVLPPYEMDSHYPPWHEPFSYTRCLEGLRQRLCAEAAEKNPDTIKVRASKYGKGELYEVVPLPPDWLRIGAGSEGLAELARHKLHSLLKVLADKLPLQVSKAVENGLQMAYNRPSAFAPLQDQESWVISLLDIASRSARLFHPLLRIVLERIVELDLSIRHGDPQLPSVKDVEKWREGKLMTLESDIRRGTLNAESAVSFLDSDLGELLLRFLQSRTEEDIDKRALACDHLLHIVFQFLESLLSSTEMREGTEKLVPGGGFDDLEEMEVPAAWKFAHNEIFDTGDKYSSSSSSGSSSDSEDGEEEDSQGEEEDEGEGKRGKGGREGTGRKADRENEEGGEDQGKKRRYDFRGIGQLISKREIVAEIFKFFEESVLATKGLRYVQFIYYYICSFHATYAEAFSLRLIKCMEREGVSVETQRHAACYLSSFASRAGFLPYDFVRLAIRRLLMAMERQLNKWKKESENEDTSAGGAKSKRKGKGKGRARTFVPIPGDTSDPRLLLFYTYAECAAYILIYRGEWLARDTARKGLDEFKDTSYGLNQLFSPTLNKYLPMRYMKMTIRKHLARLLKKVGGFETLVPSFEKEDLQDSQRLTKKARDDLAVRQTALRVVSEEAEKDRGSSAVSSASAQSEGDGTPSSRLGNLSEEGGEEGKDGMLESLGEEEEKEEEAGADGEEAEEGEGEGGAGEEEPEGEQKKKEAMKFGTALVTFAGQLAEAEKDRVGLDGKGDPWDPLKNQFPLAAELLMVSSSYIEPTYRDWHLVLRGPGKDEMIFSPGAASVGFPEEAEGGDSLPHLELDQEEEEEEDEDEDEGETSEVEDEGGGGATGMLLDRVDRRRGKRRREREGGESGSSDTGSSGEESAELGSGGSSDEEAETGGTGSDNRKSGAGGDEEEESDEEDSDDDEDDKESGGAKGSPATGTEATPDQGPVREVSNTPLFPVDRAPRSALKASQREKMGRSIKKGKGRSDEEEDEEEEEDETPPGIVKTTRKGGGQKNVGRHWASRRGVGMEGSEGGKYEEEEDEDVGRRSPFLRSAAAASGSGGRRQFSSRGSRLLAAAETGKGKWQGQESTRARMGRLTVQTGVSASRLPRESPRGRGEGHALGERKESLRSGASSASVDGFLSVRTKRETVGDSMEGGRDMQIRLRSRRGDTSPLSPALGKVPDEDEEGDVSELTPLGAAQAGAVSERRQGSPSDAADGSSWFADKEKFPSRPAFRTLASRLLSVAACGKSEPSGGVGVGGWGEKKAASNGLTGGLMVTQRSPEIPPVPDAVFSKSGSGSGRKREREREISDVSLGKSQSVVSKGSKKGKKGNIGGSGSKETAPKASKKDLAVEEMSEVKGNEDTVDKDGSIRAKTNEGVEGGRKSADAPGSSASETERKNTTTAKSKGGPLLHLIGQLNQSGILASSPLPTSSRVSPSFPQEGGRSDSQGLQSGEGPLQVPPRARDTEPSSSSSSSSAGRGGALHGSDVLRREEKERPPRSSKTNSETPSAKVPDDVSAERPHETVANGASHQSRRSSDTNRKGPPVDLMGRGGERGKRKRSADLGSAVGNSPEQKDPSNSSLHNPAASGRAERRGSEEAPPRKREKGLSTAKEGDGKGKRGKASEAPERRGVLLESSPSSSSSVALFHPAPPHTQQTLPEGNGRLTAPTPAAASASSSVAAAAAGRDAGPHVNSEEGEEEEGMIKFEGETIPWSPPHFAERGVPLSLLLKALGGPAPMPIAPSPSFHEPELVSRRSEMALECIHWLESRGDTLGFRRRVREFYRWELLHSLGEGLSAEFELQEAVAARSERANVQLRSGTLDREEDSDAD